MTGGDGADTFIFKSVAEIGKGATRDVIEDFTHLTDKMDLSALPGTLTFIGTGNFSGANQVRFFQLNPAGTANDKTIVEGNVNNDRVADFQLELTGLKTLNAGDFVL